MVVNPSDMPTTDKEKRQKEDKRDSRKIARSLRKAKIKPHKVRYYLEHRDEAFEAKMAYVLSVYKGVEMIKAQDDLSPENRKPYPTTKNRVFKR